MNPLVDGILAGYGIAIPVGAIAILIVDLGLRKGFRIAFMAGAGAASADLVYAAIAAVAGDLVAAQLAPFGTVLRLASAILLVAIGARGLWRSRRPAISAELLAAGTANESGGGTFVRFLGLTLLNPQTVAYFGALILGRDAGQPLELTGQIAFVVGAGLASWSWQSLLALVGAGARRRLTPAFQRSATIAGNLLVLALGLRIVAQLLR
jgi:threonine/homoserine/homoserine lactone efflux protein